MIESSIIRKVAMALSGLFLILFLAQHFTINFTSVFSEDLFNKLSHFMGTNPLVQFILQPILIFGVIFHFVMGFILEIKNRSARKVKYSYQSGSSSSWISRNMFFSGVVILSFLGLHFYDFWVPEIKYKYIEFLPEDPERYYEELVHKFHSPGRVAFYSISFVFLSLHLMHGFVSSFKSVGVNNKYSNTIKIMAIAFSVIVPLGFIFIAIFHHLNG